MYPGFIVVPMSGFLSAKHGSSVEGKKISASDNPFASCVRKSDKVLNVISQMCGHSYISYVLFTGEE